MLLVLYQDRFQILFWDFLMDVYEGEMNRGGNSLRKILAGNPIVLSREFLGMGNALGQREGTRKP